MTHFYINQKTVGYYNDVLTPEQGDSSSKQLLYFNSRKEALTVVLKNIDQVIEILQKDRENVVTQLIDEPISEEEKQRFLQWIDKLT